MGRLVAFFGILLVLACGETQPKPVAGKSRSSSVGDLADSLRSGGYELFYYVDEKSGDTLLMQKYFMVFLKLGPNRSQTEAEADSLQRLHLAHMKRMYEEGYSSIAGPIDSGDTLRGIVIYNTPTMGMADSLARLDPMVQAGRLQVEVLPWWAGKGFPLR